jgi:hypothetical protein
MVRARGEGRAVMPRDAIRLKAIHEASLDACNADGTDHVSDPCTLCNRVMRKHDGVSQPSYLCPLCLYSVHGSCAFEALQALCGTSEEHLVLAAYLAKADRTGVWSRERVEHALLKHPLLVSPTYFCCWCQAMV